MNSNIFSVPVILKSVLHRVSRFLAIMVLMAVFVLLVNSNASAQISDIFPDTNRAPVGSTNYTYSTPLRSADSIDSCLLRKEFFFNDLYNVWTSGVTRCKKNSKGILSKATVNGVSLDPADEQACVGKKENQIIENGTPSADEARRWSERCSYLGTVGGAGPPQNQFNIGNNQPLINIQNNSSSNSLGSKSSLQSGSQGGTLNSSSLNPLNTQEYNQFLKDVRDSSVKYDGKDLSPNELKDLRETYQRLTSEQKDLLNSRLDPSENVFLQRNVSSSSNAGGPVYNGVGIQVPDASLAPSGVTTETSLIRLIVGFTNALLPYVSVIAIFAFVASGMFYILSFANEDLNGRAKTIMTYVVIGIIIIISAYTIVNTLLTITS